MPECIQLLMGTSINRYLPANGTAGFDRFWVRGNSRVPRPPPIINPKTSFIIIATYIPIKGFSRLFTMRSSLPFYAFTPGISHFPCQFLFNPQQLIVFGNPVRPTK